MNLFQNAKHGLEIQESRIKARSLNVELLIFCFKQMTVPLSLQFSDIISGHNVIKLYYFHKNSNIKSIVSGPVNEWF